MSMTESAQEKTAQLMQAVSELVEK